jgi:glycosyltransferase involved in cell wall biosynthesis
VQEIVAYGGKMSRMRAHDVSVVIPVHNRPALVRRAVDSVLRQTAPPAEVIVVDDGSTDDTPEVLASYGDAIRVLRFRRSRERGAARNAGAAAGRTSLVAFLDSDDEWEPDKLERQRAVVAPASVTGIRIVGADGRTLKRAYAPPRSAPRRLLDRNAFIGSPSSLLIDAGLFERIGGFPEDRSVQGSEDWLLLLKLRAASVRLAVLSAPLVRYRAHPGMSTGDPDLVAGCVWSAVIWLERSQMIGGSEIRAVRAGKAAHIARRYANAGRWDAAARWVWQGVRWGSAREFVPSVPVILASGARGALRRRGI